MADDGAIRSLAVKADRCWAAGDAGLVLVSTDGGRTWHRKTVPLSANFQAVAFDAAGEAVYLLGGRAIAGHPSAAAAGVAVRSDDGGKTFRPLPLGKAGWLYGGVFAGDVGAVFGQGTLTAPGGLWRTGSGGATDRGWTPLPVAGAGALLGGDFRTLRVGYLVGRGHRIISLRSLAQPRIRPAQSPSLRTLRGARFADEDTCWAVGQNGAVLRSRPAGKPWTAVAVKLPAGMRMLADFEAIAVAPPRKLWIAGGLLGAIAHSADGGRTWKLLPAPTPGPVHALACAGAETLLAGGDGGRIWLSRDGGADWRLIRGQGRTDVLFVLSAADRSLFPAIVAHALAGCNVAVVFATRPQQPPHMEPDQPLRSAAIEAGAAGVTVLDDFDSLALGPQAAALTERQIIAAWSKALDIPAEPEMLKQLAAAIRLYRPAVLAVGPDGKGPTGPRAESRLVARLARRAAELAGEAEALPQLIEVHLTPWRVQRIFVGIEANERWRGPWEKPDAFDFSQVTTFFDAAARPQGRQTSLEMLTQRAIWQMPHTHLLDRPARFNGYKCEGLADRGGLFTTGLTEARYRRSRLETAGRDLGPMGSLRLAIMTKKTTVAATQLAATAEQQKDDPLAADRLLLAWWRLMAEGRLMHADAALDAFVKFGRGHPLYRRFNVLALALKGSGEFAAQRRTHVPRVRPGTSDLNSAAKRFASWSHWSETPAGRMLRAKVLAAGGRGPEAREVLKKLAAAPYGPDWRTCAAVELSRDLSAAGARRVVTARAISAEGKFDGLLDEPFWDTVPVLRLLDAAGGKASGDLAAGVQLVRTATHLVIAGRLPAVKGRIWRLDVAIDADRDCWTQMLLHCDSSGGQRAELLARYGPPLVLPERTLLVRGRKGGDQYTFELAVVLSAAGTDPRAGGLWNFQIRATADDYRKRTPLYLQGQADGRLLPERYAMLLIPPPAPPPVPKSQPAQVGDSPTGPKLPRP